MLQFWDTWNSLYRIYHESCLEMLACTVLCNLIYVGCVCFVNVSWDTSLHPAHCCLCPSHCSPFSAQVGLDYLLTESAYSDRGKIDPVRTHTPKPCLLCENTPLSQNTASWTFHLDHFSAYLFKTYWNVATWLWLDLLKVQDSSDLLGDSALKGVVHIRHENYNNTKKE